MLNNHELWLIDTELEQASQQVTNDLKNTPKKTPDILSSAIINSIGRESILDKNFSLNKYFFKIFFPLIIVFLIYLGYLKFINFLFNSPTYGSSSLSLDSFLQGIYFFFTIFIEFPIMIVKSLLFSNFFQFLFILTLVSVFFILLKKESIKKNYIFDHYDNKLFLIILLLSLSANFLIFFLSGYPSVTYGYYNRMLISAFISLTLILAILLNLKHNLFFLILKIVFVTLILNSSKVITNQIVEIDILKKKKLVFFLVL